MAGEPAEPGAPTDGKRAARETSLEEVLAPLREEFEHSGMSEEELVDMLEKTKHEVRAKRHTS